MSGKSDGQETRRISLDPAASGMGPEAVNVRIRRGRRTRHVRLHVDDAMIVTASVPMRFAASRLDPIVRERSEWIRDALSRMAERASTAQIDLFRGDPVRYLGRWVPTSVLHDPSKARSRVAIAPATVDLVPDPTSLITISIKPGDDPYTALSHWYRRQARQIIEDRTRYWATQYNVRFGRISIRDQRTRWGSCSHNGDLSFNWRLVLAPGWILDSIVVHELCHIAELNHSERFWTLLDQRYPRHSVASEWLREHGSALRMPEPSGVSDPHADESKNTAVPLNPIAAVPAKIEGRPKKKIGRRRLPQPVEQFQLPITDIED